MIDKILKYLQAIFFKYLLKPLFIFGLFILFREPIERIINNLFVETFFQYINRGYSKDLVLLLFLILVIRLKLKRKLGDFRFLFPTFFSVLFIYLFYRFGGSTKWQIEPLHVLPIFTYVDALFLILLLILIPFGSKTESSKSKTLFEDLPLHENYDLTVQSDDLNYNGYAKEVANKILENTFSKSFAIGINGKWGSGKTSFSNLIKKNLNKEETIVIDFNPWASINPEAILENFFEDIEDKLIENQYLVGNLFSSYTNKILNKNSNSITQFVSSIFNSSEPLNSIKERLENTISSMQKKVVIFIDDLDRLQKKEIYEVLRLVRNTSDFKNIIYIVTYDKDYVIKNLTENSETENSTFLEKIFQLEITLPQYNKETLRAKLTNNLINTFENFKQENKNSSLENKIGEIIEKLKTAANEIIHPNLFLIGNLRDVTRLSNSISLNYLPLIGEVDLKDFILLECIRIKEYEVYDLLKNHKSLILSQDESKGQPYLKLEKRNENGVNSSISRVSSILKAKYKSEIEYLIKESDILSILDLLFGEPNALWDFVHLNKVDENLSIRIPSRFDIYFFYDITNSNLPFLELNHLRVTSLVEYRELICELVEQKHEFYLKKYFEKISEFIDYQDFKNIIQTIFYFAELKSKMKNNTSLGIIGFDTENIKEKIINGYKLKHPRTGWGGLNLERDKLLEIFKDLFLVRSDKTDELFLSYFLYSCVNDNFKYQAFNSIKSGILTISEDILGKYCSKANSFDSNITFLFEKTKSGDNSDNSPIYSTRAKEIIGNFARKNLSSFLKYYLNLENKNLFLDARILDFFDYEWKNFEAFLKTITSTEEYFAEFELFYKEFKHNEHMKLNEYKSIIRLESVFSPIKTKIL